MLADYADSNADTLIAIRAFNAARERFQSAFKRVVRHSGSKRTTARYIWQAAQDIHFPPRWYATKL